MATWVIGDIHGCYNEFMALLSSPLIKEDDTIILIGDIIDRGPDSLKMLKWAIENVTSDGRFQMICGNREGYERIKDVRPFIMWFKKLPLTKRIMVMSPEGYEQEYIIAHGWYGKRLERINILWDRDIDAHGRFKNDYVPAKNEILIHGHTPIFVELGYPEDGRAHFREHSINIDCGCVYGVTEQIEGRLAALRLEDRRVIYQEPLTIEDE